MIALLDIDGTLVDSNYHHAISWYRALRAYDLTVPIVSIHRGIGMGGDQLVEHLCGEEAEAEHGDAVRTAEGLYFKTLMPEVRPFTGARGLVEELKRRGHAVVLASSAKPEELEHYLDLVGVRELADDWTGAGDVEQTKPAPDLVEVAMEKAGGQDAVMVGDSTWDCEAAGRAGVATLAVLTGGFSAPELTDAGAEATYGSIVELRDRLDDTPLA